MSPSTRGCGCFGCRGDAVAVIDHPEHGERTVCGAHIDGYDVDEWLVDPAEIDHEEVSADV